VGHKWDINWILIGKGNIILRKKGYLKNESFKNNGYLFLMLRDIHYLSYELSKDKIH